MTGKAKKKKTNNIVIDWEQRDDAVLVSSAAAYLAYTFVGYIHYLLQSVQLVLIVSNS